VAKVLVVDDDPTVREVVVSYLKAAQHEVLEAADGESVAAIMRDTAADLVVLDLMLPGIDGLEVCRRLRASSDVPVIMLTALGSETDRVVGLERGADDYVTKPFGYGELRLRIAAVLNRSRSRLNRGRIQVGQIEIDPGARMVTVCGQPVQLAAKEFALLRTLAAAPTRVFTKEELLRDVWGFRARGATRTLDSHACRLRQKLRTHGDDYVINVWGVGYRLVDGPF
jgi:two-component system phosphate regulon response regulator PhoB